MCWIGRWWCRGADVQGPSGPPNQNVFSTDFPTLARFISPDIVKHLDWESASCRKERQPNGDRPLKESCPHPALCSRLNVTAASVGAHELLAVDRSLNLMATQVGQEKVLRSFKNKLAVKGSGPRRWGEFDNVRAEICVGGLLSRIGSVVDLEVKTGAGGKNADYIAEVDGVNVFFEVTTRGDAWQANLTEEVSEDHVLSRSEVEDVQRATKQQSPNPHDKNKDDAQQADESPSNTTRNLIEQVLQTKGRKFARKENNVIVICSGKTDVDCRSVRDACYGVSVIGQQPGSSSIKKGFALGGFFSSDEAENVAAVMFLELDFAERIILSKDMASSLQGKSSSALFRNRKNGTSRSRWVAALAAYVHATVDGCGAP